MIHAAAHLTAGRGLQAGRGLGSGGGTGSDRAAVASLRVAAAQRARLGVFEIVLAVPAEQTAPGGQAADGS